VERAAAAPFSPFSSPAWRSSSRSRRVARCCVNHKIMIAPVAPRGCGGKLRPCPGGAARAGGGHRAAEEGWGVDGPASLSPILRMVGEAGNAVSRLSATPWPGPTMISCVVAEPPRQASIAATDFPPPLPSPAFAPSALRGEGTGPHGECGWAIERQEEAGPQVRRGPSSGCALLRMTACGESGKTRGFRCAGILRRAAPSSG
jgi:hypothetical protein